MAEEAVSTREVGPRFRYCGLVFDSMKRFQRAAQLPCLDRLWGIVSFPSNRSFGAGVAHPIEMRLQSTPTRQKVHGTVFANDSIGHRKGRPVNEWLELSSVPRALRCEMHGVDRPEGPVEGKERVAVLGREFSLTSLDHAGRGAWAHFDHGRQAVFIVGRPFP